MEPTKLLTIFVVLKICQIGTERLLAYLNKSYINDPARASEAGKVLGIDESEMKKASLYSGDKYSFGMWSSLTSSFVTLGFIIWGGLTWVESLAQPLGQITGLGLIGEGLAFFMILGVLSGILELPFDLYHTFVLEEKHGFNKQTLKGFFLDRVKSLAIGVILGGAILGLILGIMEGLPESWWFWAWLAMFGFNLVIAWLYPSLLAPIFNKFTPLEEGELKTKIFELARKVEFNADAISLMNASIRSSHGNAYFTGVFGKKKIVLFDTLVDSMLPDEIVAVLAHELGHFKLNHVRWMLVRSFFVTGLMFFGMSIMYQSDVLFQAFGLSSATGYGALLVFSLWLSPLGFIFQLFSNWLSRRNEYQADAFALAQVEDKRKLGDALLKLRQKSHSMPITHPAFSAFYHSHPPMLDRLKAMGYID